MKLRALVCLLLLTSLAAFLVSCASSYDLDSISISPPNATVASTGTTVQFKATAVYICSSHPSRTNDVTNQVTWASSNTNVATVDSSGIATAVNVGSTTITATLNGHSATASMGVTIGPRSLTALTILPGAQLVSALGQTAQFIAIGTFSDIPTTEDMTDRVTWIANNADVATINSTGLATSLPCTTPATGCSTPITAIFTNVNGSTITATSMFSDFVATNNAPLPSLTVYNVGQGSGAVVSSPAGINCGAGASCTANFPLSSTVTLTAIPAKGTTSVFIGWSSNCVVDPSNPLVCSVPMQNNQTVGAIFALSPTP
jgi:Bacterial Ig-like domain (group 2)